MDRIKRLALFPSPAITTSLFIVLFCNSPLWQKLFAVKGGLSLETLAFYAPFFTVLTALLILFFTLFRFKYLFKCILILFLLVTALIDYFMSAYGVVIDKTMLQNALETNPQEAFELVNLNMGAYFFALGVLPSVYIAKHPTQYLPIGKQLLANSKTLLLCLGLMGGLVFFFYGSYTSIYRNDRQIRYLISPVNLVDSLVSNVKRILKANHPLIVIGADATLAANRNQSAKKNLTIFVVGETARAANFSLDGYSRNTNPLLAKENIINFSQVTSCGTATAASVPCLFSGTGRDLYDASKAEYTENLMDVFKHAGVSILWRNNNDSCKGVCNRVTYQDMAHLKLDGLCSNKECYDEVLLHQLQGYLDQQTKDTIIVLHQKGSHGPGYHLRHPPEFTVFTPECDKAMLNDCSQQDVINAYDNTLVYTDYFLHQVIALLKQNDARFNAAMLYVSDHGESLGENNVYLHGLPYFIAPDEQKHVPMIGWFSDDFITNNQLNMTCLKQHSSNPYSHDNIFHSLLGVMGVSTQVYNAKLDIFASCRS